MGVHEDDPAFVVAVKLVSPAMQSEPSFIAALRQECRLLDTIDHPSIVRFRDLVVRDGVMAMVLELLDGEDLEAALAAGARSIVGAATDRRGREKAAAALNAQTEAA